MNSAKNNKGFTLVELLVAISILGIIMVIAFPQISNIQTKNQKTKYKKYAESVLSSGKLYTDSYTEDMFGNNKSGCIDITYSEMKNKELLKDIKVAESTCASEKTFVRVRKSNDHYTYEAAIYCKDKNGKVVYEVQLPGTCDGAGPDITGPTISFDKNGSDWTKGINLTTKILLYDDYGLLENAKIKYAWFIGETIQGEWVTKEFKNKRYEGTTSEKLSVEVTVPQNATGEYKLKVEPVDVRDVNGNWLTGTVTSNAFKLDNTAPNCGLNNGSTDWTKEARTINVQCNDSHSECKQSFYSKIYNSGTTKTDSVTIEDKVGNTRSCSYNVYVDKEAPTPPTTGAIGDVSGSNASASIKTAAGGSSDVNNGSGVKEYRYLITNSSTKPTDKTLFTTSRNFTRSCGTSYYAWAIAVDNVGNMSEVKSLGNTADGKDASSWSECTKKCGTGYQYEYNTCDLKETTSRTCNEQACCSSTEPTGCTAWTWTSCTASCGDSGTRYETRTCNLKSTYDGSSCSGTITQTRNENSACNRRDCCSSTVVKSYGEWESCSATCGPGKKYRDVYLVSAFDDTISCGKRETQDEGDCNAGACAHTCYSGEYITQVSAEFLNYRCFTRTNSGSWDNCNCGNPHSQNAGDKQCIGRCIHCGKDRIFTWCPDSYKLLSD